MSRSPAQQASVTPQPPPLPNMPSLPPLQKVPCLRLRKPSSPQPQPPLHSCLACLHLFCRQAMSLMPCLLVQVVTNANKHELSLSVIKENAYAREDTAMPCHAQQCPGQGRRGNIAGKRRCSQNVGTEGSERDREEEASVRA